MSKHDLSDEDIEAMAVPYERGDFESKHVVMHRGSRLDTVRKRLVAIVGEDAVQAAAPLAVYTSFQVGGPAQWLVEPADEEEIAQVVAFCREACLPLTVLGLGSNVLVADRGVDGVVMRLAERFSRIGSVDVLTDQGTPMDGCVLLYAQAGASNEAVAQAALAEGLTGYEFASGIPGSIGGAAIMNAGAYGGEFRDVAQSVRCLTPTGDIVAIDAAEAEWSYRHSMMMERGYIVLGATLGLRPGDPAEIAATMEDLAARRREKQPLELPSAGSTFKRPEGYFAGKLIQDAGLRGHRIGGAQVSEKHCGFVVNAGQATASDVRDLIEYVRVRVHDTSGVYLEPEVRLWGFESE